MSQDNNIKQKIQGTSLSDYGDSAAWQYLKWGSLAVVIIVLLVIPNFVGAYFQFVLSLCSRSACVGEGARSAGGASACAARACGRS